MSRFIVSREHYIQIYVPQNASKIVEGSGLADVYVCTDASGRLAAMAFVGKWAKPVWNCSFRTVEQRDQKIEALFCGLRVQKDQAIAFREQRSRGHAFQVNDIVYTSWGYDQTNIDWYRVARVTAHSVWLKPLESTEAESIGSMSSLRIPGKELDKPEQRHRAYGDHITIGRYSGSKWSGKPLHYSTYA